MKKISLLTLAMVSSLVHGQARADQVDSKDASAPAQARRRSYISVLFGDGRTSDGDTLGRKAYQLRMGESVGEKTRVDLVYDNEGHPFNNHRDGFALQGVYSQPISKRVKVEVGAGPYFSMNTTTQNGQDTDQKRFGVMASAAVLYYINSNVHLRAEFDHVMMPGSFSTDAMMVGVGKDFGGSDRSSDRSDELKDAKFESPKHPFQMSVMLSDSKTNRSGSQDAIGYQVEFKNDLGERMAFSVSWISEGSDQVGVDRKGVAAQVWYVVPLTDKWKMSAGIGPYVAQNALGSNKINLNGLVSLQVERTFGENDDISVFVRLNRVIAAEDNASDRDMFELGTSKRW